MIKLSPEEILEQPRRSLIPPTHLLEFVEVECNETGFAFKSEPVDGLFYLLILERHKPNPDSILYHIELRFLTPGRRISHPMTITLDDFYRIPEIERKKIRNAVSVVSGDCKRVWNNQSQEWKLPTSDLQLINFLTENEIAFTEYSDGYVTIHRSAGEYMTVNSMEHLKQKTLKSFVKRYKDELNAKNA